MTALADPLPASVGATLVSPCVHATAWVDDDAARLRCESELAAANIPLPLAHTVAWARAFPSHANRFLSITDESNRCIGGFAVAIHKSRALPGHLLLRADRISLSIPPSAFVVPLTQLLADYDNGRTLRINLELFSRDEPARQTIAAMLAACGFAPVAPMKNYASTIALDLKPSEDQIFANVHSTARRHIRAVSKHPLELRPISDTTLIPRLDQLTSETQQRTGGDYTPPRWSSVIALSQDHPHRSRLVGMFRTDITGPESLLAFAWSHHHGDHAHYDASASTRNTDIKAPLAYALLWDLCLWAKRNGASWFDFGGITQGSHASGDTDPIGGISDFKRYFSKAVVNVAEEWMLEPSPLRSKLARAISSAVHKSLFFAKSPEKQA